MRVVLDTNILVSAFLYGGLPLGVLRLADAGVIEVITSEAALSEFGTVLERPKFRERLRELGFSARTAVRRYRELAAIVEASDRPGICADPADDEFIAIAVASEADIIVSGDRHLLTTSARSPIPVVTAAEFLAAVRESRGSLEEPD
jgi:uncharacterized protein